MKNIVFSDHAKDRLKERGIRESQVKAAPGYYFVISAAWLGEEDRFKK